MSNDDGNTYFVPPAYVVPTESGVKLIATSEFIGMNLPQKKTG